MKRRRPRRRKKNLLKRLKRKEIKEREPLLKRDS